MFVFHTSAQNQLFMFLEVLKTFVSLIYRSSYKELQVVMGAVLPQVFEEILGERSNIYSLVSREPRNSQAERKGYVKRSLDIFA